MRQKPIILLIEDDKIARDDMAAMFGNIYQFLHVPDAAFTHRLLEDKTRQFDLVLLDLELEEGSSIMAGLDLIPDIQSAHPHVPIIILSQYYQGDNVRNAYQAGVQYFMAKSELDAIKSKRIFDEHIAKGKLKKAKAAAEKEKQVKSKGASTRPKNEEDTINANLIGQTPQILEIKEELEALSEEPDITVLITGETGVGKEVAARYLHAQGVRATKPFEAVHLAGLPKQLITSSLFGHKKGSFTNALTEEKGAFRRAHTGVIFLDEIGEIDAETQVKLLRVLEYKVITPIGESERKVDVQIIVATNRDLKEEVKRGTFREDLYYRIEDYTVHIPPLRERKADIPLLLDFLCQKKGFAKGLFTEEAIKKLLDYDYPGNVRELQNIVKKVHLKYRMKKAKEIEARFLPNEVLHDEMNNVTSKSDIQPTTINTFQPLSIAAEKAKTELEAIEKALIKTGGKKQAAGDLLKIEINTLRNRVERYFERYPQLFEDSAFPMIVKKYKLK